MDSVCSALSWVSLPTSLYTPIQVRAHRGGSSEKYVAVLMVNVSVLILRVRAVIFFVRCSDIFVFMFENMTQEQK